jgi:hypothetical protein
MEKKLRADWGAKDCSLLAAQPRVRKSRAALDSGTGQFLP